MSSPCVGRRHPPNIAFIINIFLCGSADLGRGGKVEMRLNRVSFSAEAVCDVFFGTFWFVSDRWTVLMSVMLMCFWLRHTSSWRIRGVSSDFIWLSGWNQLMLVWPCCQKHDFDAFLAKTQFKLFDVRDIMFPVSSHTTKIVGTLCKMSIETKSNIFQTLFGPKYNW